MARFVPKHKAQHVGTFALTGMAQARRDQAPTVRARVGQCPKCGREARLPIGEVGAVCSGCELGQIR